MPHSYIRGTRIQRSAFFKTDSTYISTAGDDVVACCSLFLQAISSTHAVFTNGYVFDELPLPLVEAVAKAASEAGAAVCFDPGQ